MSVAIRTATRIADQDDLGSVPGAGNDGYALTWDNGAGEFVLTATGGAYLPLAGGTMTGALDFNYQGANRLYANVLTVSAAGGADYTTITAAIAAATALTPGAANRIAIMVYPGTYSETWTLPQYVSMVAPGGGVTCTSAAIAGPVFTFAGSQNVVNIRFQAAQNSTYQLCLVTAGAVSFYNCQMYGYAAGSSTICYTLRFEAASGKLYLFNSLLDMVNYGSPAVTRASALSVLGYPSSQEVYAYNTIFRAARLSGTGTYIGLHSQVDLESVYFGCTIVGSTYSVYCGNPLWLTGGSISGATFRDVFFGDNALHRGVSNVAAAATTMSAAAATDKLLILKGAASQSANLQEWQDSSGNALFAVEADGDLRTSRSAANTNTPSGATARQLAIYDAAGTLLGYIPIYGSAW